MGKTGTRMVKIPEWRAEQLSLRGRRGSNMVSQKGFGLNVCKRLEVFFKCTDQCMHDVDGGILKRLGIILLGIILQ